MKNSFYLRIGACSYCSNTTYLRGTPYMADIERKAYMCKVCWDKCDTDEIGEFYCECVCHGAGGVQTIVCGHCEDGKTLDKCGCSCHEVNGTEHIGPPCCEGMTITKESYPIVNGKVVNHGVLVKHVYYREPTPAERKENPYWTGLVLELENGLKFQQNSTDCIQTYSVIKPNV